MTDERRMPALDGIRAFAVLAVITYHGGVGWMRGGYYGVDAFLVLSGFLITSLLVGEWDRRATISLAGFWARRARRLLPALFLMLTGVAVVAGIWPSVLAAPHLMADTIATVFYAANWHLVAEHASYFGAVNQPSPLLHTWTLAIEEQFYLLWPLIVLAVLGRRSIRRGANRGADRVSRLRRLLVIASVGAVGSAVWMVVLAPTDGSDPSRAYYGSDTRAQGLLVGAAMAVACALRGPVRTRAGARALGAIGVAGAVGAAAMWAWVPETSQLAFHGGFAVVTWCCAAVVLCAARAPRTALARVLALAPLRYLGRISYGMYLWYWPVLLVMNGARTGLHGYPLLVLRLAVVVALAAASYHLVETPIRRGSLSGWRARLAVPGAAAASVGAMLAATTLAPTAALAAPGSGGPSDATVLLASPVAMGSAAASGSGTAPVDGAAPLKQVVSGAPGNDAPTSGSQATGPQATGVPVNTASAVGTAASAPSLGAGATSAGTSRGNAPDRVRVLLVGDSMAGSLGVGLAAVAPKFGAEVVNEGMPGCSLSQDQLNRVLWYTLPPGPPCALGNPAVLLSTWRQWVDATRPDVVVYIARSEVLDQQHGGQWAHLGDSDFNAWVKSRFEAAVPVLSSGGAKVVLLTSPLYDTGEQSSGSPWPEDDPNRVTVDNSIMQAVAAATPAVTVLDAGADLTPDGTYRTQDSGVTLRCPDGVHVTRSGGEWLGARLFPTLVALGRPHAGTPAARSRPPVTQPSAPAWWSKLSCNA